MTDATTLLALAERAEKAGANEQRKVLVDAAFEISNGEWLTLKAGRFLKMLDAEAYESAALMLVPEGWAIDLSVRTVANPTTGGRCSEAVVTVWKDEPGGWLNGRVRTTAATPALALVAAALCAKGEGA